MATDFSFFIYDYESFGINPASDRPAQFAGIRTDADFNIIGEPIMLYSDGITIQIIKMK